MSKKKKHEENLKEVLKEENLDAPTGNDEVKDEEAGAYKISKDEAQAVDSEEENQESEDLVAKLSEEVSTLNDKYLRLNAEFQNYRKRVEKEKSDIFKYGNEKLIIELLPIMDNFERAMASFEEDHAEDKVLSGVKMIKKSIDDFFDKNGVKKIDALNQAFDHDKHHAVMSEAVEGVEAEVVVEVFQEGYMMADKVIRPSMVKVSC